MKKTRSIRFNNMVDVYKEVPIPLIDKEDIDVIEPATDEEDSDVTEPAKIEEHTEVTEEAMGKEESKVTEPAMDEEDINKTEEAMDKEESKVTESTMDKKDSNVTEPAMETESNEIEPAMEIESKVTEPAMDTDINVTESAMHTHSNVTESAMYKDSHVTEPAMHTHSYVTQPSAIGSGSIVTGPAVVINSNMLKPITDAEDEHVNEIALDLAENVITAALNIVEEDDEYTIKNINWLTHGEFTPEKCRKQIEDFVTSWEYQDRWVHYAKLVEIRDLVHSFHYIYSVRWSVPTSQTPTAFSSAFAFFTVKFNKNKPPDAPIEISYIFEGQSLLHRPGTTRFRENWVKEMVVAKHNIMKSFPF